MNRFALLPFALALALAGPVSAAESIVRAAADTVTTGAPESGPALSPVAAGTPVTVTGCLADRSWCRVIIGGLPGWMAGAMLAFPLQGRIVTVATDGDALAIPVVDRAGVGIAPDVGGPVDIAPPPGGG